MTDDGTTVIWFSSRSAVFGELSNFYVSPFHVVEPDGRIAIWPSVEHYYQAHKTRDPREREAIRSAVSSLLARRIGRRATLRGDWAAVRDGVMRRALRAKFSQSYRLRELLVGTGQAVLHESSPDPYWGGSTGGQDRLGQLLMQVRAELRLGVVPSDPAAMETTTGE